MSFGQPPGTSPSVIRQRRLVTVKTMLLIPLAVALLTVGIMRGKQIIELSEFTKPDIHFKDTIRGIGIAPVSLSVVVSDSGAGLRNVQVTTTQLGITKVVQKKDFNGQKTGELLLKFPGASASEFAEGEVDLTISATDGSFWRSTAVKSIKLPVDFQRPILQPKVIPSQMVRGGSGLLFLKADDSQFAVAGVKIGDSTFLASPAFRFDPTVHDDSLYGVLFTVPISAGENPTIRVFAEDRVGNVATEEISPRLTTPELRTMTLPVADSLVRERIEPAVRNYPEYFSQFEANEPSLGIRAFKFWSEQIRKIDEVELLKALQVERTDRHWFSTFLPLPGQPREKFADQIRFSLGNQTLDGGVSPETTFVVSSNAREITVAADGTVSYVGLLATSGPTIVVDHGLGLSTVYSNLESLSVSQGDRIESGATLGKAAKDLRLGGFSFSFQVRVSGVPANPAEWTDSLWYRTQIEGRINELRRQLNLPVYQIMN